MRRRPGHLPPDDQVDGVTAVRGRHAAQPDLERAVLLLRQREVPGLAVGLAGEGTRGELDPVDRAAEGVDELLPGGRPLRPPAGLEVDRGDAALAAAGVLRVDAARRDDDERDRGHRRVVVHRVDAQVLGVAKLGADGVGDLAPGERGRERRLVELAEAEPASQAGRRVAGVEQHPVDEDPRGDGAAAGAAGEAAQAVDLAGDAAAQPADLVDAAALAQGEDDPRQLGSWGVDRVGDDLGKDDVAADAAAPEDGRGRQALPLRGAHAVPGRRRRGLVADLLGLAGGLGRRQERPHSQVDDRPDSRRDQRIEQQRADLDPLRHRRQDQVVAVSCRLVELVAVQDAPVPTADRRQALPLADCMRLQQLAIGGPGRDLEAVAAVLADQSEAATDDDHRRGSSGRIQSCATVSQTRDQSAE